MSDLVVKYKWWKQSLHKWDSYIQNKNKKEKQVDPWCRFILDSVVDEKTMAYNCGGMFFKDIDKDIIVVENADCPLSIADITNTIDVKGKFDNLIMINPITLKYNSSILDFLTVPQDTRGGWKPDLTSWLNAHGKIFLSFSDWHIYYDRLKYSATDMIEAQLNILEQHGIHCVKEKIDDVNIDVENGNVKMVLQVE